MLENLYLLSLFVFVLAYPILRLALPNEHRIFKKRWAGICFPAIFILIGKANYLAEKEPSRAPKIAFVILWITAAVLLVTMARKRHYGFKFIVPLGGMSNVLVVLVNHWKMPADRVLVEKLGANLSNFHSFTNQSTHLGILCDKIYSPFIINNSVASIGDICIYLGFVITAAQISLMYLRRS